MSDKKRGPVKEQLATAARVVEQANMLLWRCHETLFPDNPVFRDIGEHLSMFGGSFVRRCRDLSEPSVCRWRIVHESGTWDTGCGHMFEFINDGPEENGLKFCPYCGGWLHAEREAGKGGGE